MPYTSYFMFRFYIIIYISHMTEKLSIKRRGASASPAICGGGSPYMMLAKRGKCLSDKYLELLEKKILPSVHCYALALQRNNEDNCPIHTSRAVTR